MLLSPSFFPIGGLINADSGRVHPLLYSLSDSGGRVPRYVGPVPVYCITNIYPYTSIISKRSRPAKINVLYFHPRANHFSNFFKEELGCMRKKMRITIHELESIESYGATDNLIEGTSHDARSAYHNHNHATDVPPQQRAGSIVPNAFSY